mmetsp:Transcript_81080/g.262576  ORF Transcript_81080/g.262576 Transcript_81080/m.262576 type:complete len:243 (-) Transcript_81080:362-1090(-)
MLQVKPPTWKSGSMFRQQSVGVSWRVSFMQHAPTMRLPWVLGTSFGFLVVPEVCSSSAILSATWPDGRGIGSGTSSPDSEKSPATVASGSKTIMGTPAVFLEACCDVASTAFAGRSEMMKASSWSPVVGSMGAKPHCAETAKSATAVSGPLPKIAVILSPPPMPKRARPARPLSRNRRSCAYVKAWRPSTDTTKVASLSLIKSLSNVASGQGTSAQDSAMTSGFSATNLSSLSSLGASWAVL